MLSLSNTKKVCTDCKNCANRAICRAGKRFRLTLCRIRYIIYRTNFCLLHVFSIFQALSGTIHKGKKGGFYSWAVSWMGRTIRPELEFLRQWRDRLNRFKSRRTTKKEFPICLGTSAVMSTRWLTVKHLSGLSRSRDELAFISADKSRLRQKKNPSHFAKLNATDLS